jgi:hypothetical protein
LSDRPIEAPGVHGVRRAASCSEDDMDNMAITVNELEPGRWHYSLLRAVDTPDDLLAFVPVLTDQTVHDSATEAWIDAIFGITAYLDRLRRPPVDLS